MRAISKSASGKLRVAAFAGTRVVLIALDIDQTDCRGLRGFAFKRSIAGGQSQWLTGMKVFPSLAPKQPAPGDKPIHFATNENPIQSFIWSDYEALQNTEYTFEVTSMYGTPDALQPGETVSLSISTELEDDGKHGIWVNRGAIASQAFAEQFGNKSLTPNEYNDTNNKEVQWLSRGLLEACLHYIKQTPRGDALRVCAYEFTYLPILLELKRAIDRGVDVRIVYHATSANETAVTNAKLPKKNAKGEPILFKRTRPPIPHNKFIVQLKASEIPYSVWTGSTNFTPSGFLGQTNVGHLVTDEVLAGTYLKFWEDLSKNPDTAAQKLRAMTLSPNPKNVPPAGTMPIFSARYSDKMLNWYGARVGDAATSAMFTGAFSVDPKILGPMAKSGPSMRFILLERPPTPAIVKAQKANAASLMFSYGAVLAKMQQKVGKDASGNRTKKWVPIPNFELDKWFVGEELERKSGDGFVFFIHTKFLLIDPLSDDPLVCTGSANFSKNSLTSNDENMLLVRGNTRVADIYLTEFDRVFRHFASRNAANEIAKSHKRPNFGLLDEGDKWWFPYFSSKDAKNHRRQMFFADPASTWAVKAGSDPNSFVGEKASATTRRKSTKKRSKSKKSARSARKRRY